MPTTALSCVLLRVRGSDGDLVGLLEYRGVRRLPAAAWPCDPGPGHLCLGASGARTARAIVSLDYRSRWLGVVDITTSATAGGRIVYMADPDGHWVALPERPGA